MKTNHLALTLTLGASVMLFSCEKASEVTGMTYQVTTSAAPATVSGRTAADGIVKWTAGYASVVEIEFEAESKSAEVEFKSEARRKVDLFSPMSTLGVINVPAGTYKDIEFEVEVQPNGADKALQLNGTFTDGNGEVTPIVFTVNKELEIETKQSDVVVADGATMTALTTFNLSSITTGVTESMLRSAVRTGGVIEISDTSNKRIWDTIYDNLKKCGGVKVK